MPECEAILSDLVKSIVDLFPWLRSVPERSHIIQQKDTVEKILGVTGKVALFIVEFKGTHPAGKYSDKESTFKFIKLIS